MPASAQVLQGMDATELDAAESEIYANFVEQITSKIDNAVATLYWTDLPDGEFRSDVVYTKKDQNTKDFEDGLENS